MFCKLVQWKLLAIPILMILLLNQTTAIGETEDDTLKYAIILTGTELLKGVYADGHTLFLTRTLNPLGSECVASISVGDTKQDLMDALDYAAQHANLILITGGLGPTKDDITREVLSDYSNIALQEAPELIEYLKNRFNRTNLQSNTQKLALVPENGQYMPNPNGTAAGLIYESNNHTFVAMPGPPQELQPMVQNYLLPYMQERFGIHRIGASITMRFVGIGESSIDQVIEDHIALPENIILSSLFNYGRVDLTFGLPGDSEQEWQILRDLESDLLSHIGEYLYSDEGENLEQIVLQKLKSKGQTIETAEIGSGGALASSFIFSGQLAEIFKGAHVAPSNDELMNMLQFDKSAYQDNQGAEWVVALAQFLSDLVENRWTIVVSEVFTTEESPFVWVGLGSTQTGFLSQKIYLRGQGDSMRDRLVTSILDQVRRRLDSVYQP